jgi:predicted ester cyclase
MPTATDLVRRFYDDVWNHQDEAAAREILHADFRFRGSLGPELRGVDGFIDYLRAIHRALGSYTCIVDDLVATTDRAAARMRFRGIHRARFFGVEATGREIIWAAGAFFTTDGKQIVALWVVGDVDSVKRQLGVAAETIF